MSARFPQPGIQIGFGFAVSGIGGIFGLSRRADLDGLTGAVLDGTLGALLFPDDPQRDAPRVAAALPRLFPAAPGRVLFGPMLELNWAGGLVRGQAAVIVEMPNPPKFVFLGRLVLDLPTSDLALVHIEARFMAAFDLGVPELRIVASLGGSYIVGLELHGDLFLLVRGGPRSTFVLSAGGFHPAVQPPEGVPALQRIGMTLSIPIVELRYESYVAITTTSVQFGAKVELTAEIAGCGVHGWLGFDALFEWVPRFRFSVGITAGIEVEVFGETVAGVRLEGLLEGPSPWHIRAHGEVRGAVRQGAGHPRRDVRRRTGCGRPPSGRRQGAARRAGAAVVMGDAATRGGPRRRPAVESEPAVTSLPGACSIRTAPSPSARSCCRSASASSASAVTPSRRSAGSSPASACARVRNQRHRPRRCAISSRSGRSAR